MKSVSTGIRAESPSRAGDADEKRAGFTLIEALVALALVLAFAEVLGPYLFHARKIMINAEGRVAAQVLLRSLLDAPFDRSQLANASRGGETAGLRWHIVTEPMTTGAAPSRGPWTAFRVTASVSSGGGQVITAETVRLAKLE
jgi:prepilin-type N-terminal cleavage/methylation domain-containing protein